MSDRFVLGAILVLSLCLRLYKLNAGLWYDEVATLVSFTRPSFSWLLSNYPSLNHHIFFSLQAKTCIALFGETPFALRLPAALLGTGSVAVLWFLAREVSSRAVAHLSALFLTVAYHHVWFSQNGRGYTGILFFGLLAVLFYVRGMTAGSLSESRRNAMGLAVSAALMLYTHLSAAFLLFTLGIVHVGDVMRRRRRRVPDDDERRQLAWSFRGLTLGGVLAVLLYLPIVPQLLSSFSHTSASSSAGGLKGAAISHWNSPLWMLKEVASSFSELGPLVLVAASSVMLVVAGGMLRMVKRGQATIPVLFVVHVPLTIALLKLGSMRIWPRYFFADIGFIVLFLIEGAAWLGALFDGLATRLLGRRLRGGEHASVALGALGVLAAAAMLPKNYRYPKQDLAGARDFVEKHRSPGSKVLTLGLASLPYSEYYAPSWEKVDGLEGLLAFERSTPELWVVYAFPNVTKGRLPAVMARLDHSFEVAARLPGTMGDGDVVVLESKTGKRASP